MWVHKNTFAIGGLENIGYSPNSDYLIVLSSQGQGIFNCEKGEKTARNYDDWWDNFNEEDNTVKGSGIFENKIISTCGLYGDDNLPKVTSGGWSLEITDPEPDDYPFQQYKVSKIYLLSPDKNEKILVAKDGPCEYRAYGFSPTEKSFVIALSCEIVIYANV